MYFVRVVLLLCSFLTASLQGGLVTEHESVYFSPEDNVEKRLIELIEEEKESIYIAIYCLTHREISDALISAKKRGVDVQVIVDKYSVKVRSSLAKMVDAGVFVSVWDPGKGKKDKQALMHNKFCVFGSEAVWTGSFNFTYRASRLHQENVVVLRNKEIAAEFKKQFNNIKLRGCLPFSSYIMYHAHKPAKKHVKK